MTERIEGLLNNARARLTQLYPDETLSRAMFSIMGVLEELSDNITTPNSGLTNQWLQSMTIRMNKLDSIHNSINGALENVLGRICNLEDKFRNLGQPIEKWSELDRLIHSTRGDLKVLKDKTETMIEHLSDMVEELED
jgi:hypothetical protein